MPLAGSSSWPSPGASCAASRPWHAPPSGAENVSPHGGQQDQTSGARPRQLSRGTPLRGTRNEASPCASPATRNCRSGPCRCCGAFLQSGVFQVSRHLIEMFLLRVSVCVWRCVRHEINSVYGFQLADR